MKPTTLFTASVLVCLLPTWDRATAAPKLAGAPSLDTAAIEELTGAKGALDAKEGVFKVSLPRADIKATAAGVRMTPPLGLTAWAAFTRAGKHTMVMGDIVLLEDQVNPVMSAALDAGLEVTALHNHFFWDNAEGHVHARRRHGRREGLAGAVGKVFARLKETAGGKGEVPSADIDPAKTTLTPGEDRSACSALQGRAQGRRLQGRRRPDDEDGRPHGRQADGRQHLGGVRRQRRQGGGRRRLRDARVGAAAGAEGAARGRHRRRRHPQPHDGREPAHHVPALLGRRSHRDAARSHQVGARQDQTPAAAP